MNLNIADFLPKYPNVDNYDYQPLNPYDSFYEPIYKKKEFYDQKLSRYEPFTKQTGDLMKHQKFLSRFFSSNTPYNSILLFHEMGSGKTCSAIGMIEQIKNENNTYTGALIFARGQGLLNNFTNELLFKCTSGEYIPEDYANLDALTRVHRVKKSISVFYKLFTFEKFAKHISGLTDEYIRKNYSNKIIVIDEVHNIRIQDKKSTVNIYDQFYRLLHVVENCKVILMSGTPMKSYFLLCKYDFNIITHSFYLL